MCYCYGTKKDGRKSTQSEVAVKWERRKSTAAVIAQGSGRMKMKLSVELFCFMLVEVRWASFYAEDFSFPLFLFFLMNDMKCKHFPLCPLAPLFSLYWVASSSSSSSLLYIFKCSLRGRRKRIWGKVSQRLNRLFILSSLPFRVFLMPFPPNTHSPQFFTLFSLFIQFIHRDYGFLSFPWKTIVIKISGRSSTRKLFLFISR